MKYWDSCALCNNAKMGDIALLCPKHQKYALKVLREKEACLRMAARLKAAQKKGILEDRRINEACSLLKQIANSEIW